ncbi:MAG: nucleoside deaminase [Rubrivivax sp.]|nr:nucleoside deaminase [Rubrivivax sp.]
MRSLTSRRLALAWTAATALPLAAAPGRAADAALHPQRRWYERAHQMLLLAQSLGDQSYGAVVVLGDAEVGLGPSRVVKDRDPDAHAERVALREAERALGRADLGGAVLYSTSRPCRVCEAAAARAGIARMFHGPALLDAGVPQP